MAVTYANGNGASALEGKFWATTESAKRVQAAKVATFAQDYKAKREDILRTLIEDATKAREKELLSAQAASERIILGVKEKTGTLCERVYLRHRYAGVFDAVFFFSLVEFHDDAFLDAYDVAWEESEGIMSQGIEYNFEFAPLRGEIEHRSLVVDGYFHWLPTGEGDAPEDGLSEEADAAK